MPIRYFLVPALLLAAAAPLPDLRVEPTTGGSYFYIKNTATQPLTAYLIELVDYPGSSYSLYVDDAAGEPLAPGAERKTRVSSMTVGAVPDYVKMQAAVYADGTTAGIPEKIALLLERRHRVLETTTELIARLEKPGETPDGLRKWAATLVPPGKKQIPPAEAAAWQLIMETAAQLSTKSPAEIVEGLKVSQKALQNNKP
jgi:hypothetical protein